MTPLWKTLRKICGKGEKRMEEMLDCIEAKDRERASQIFKALEGMKIYEALLLLDACKDAFTGMEIQFHADGRD